MGGTILGGAGLSGESGNGAAYVGLAVEDIAAAAHVLGDGFGMRGVEVEAGEGPPIAVFAVGETALALFPVGHALLGDGGSKAGVHHLALISSDPEAAAAASRLPEAGDPGQAMVGLAGRRAVAIPAEATVGVRLRYHEPFDIRSGSALGRSDSQEVDRIDHLGVASTDNEAAIAMFHKRLGFPVESRQTDREVHVPVESFTSDKYGIVYHSREPVQQGALDVAFVTVGDFDLEFLRDTEAVGAARARARAAAGNTQQDRGAISRFVERRGPGLHHLAFKTRSIVETLERLRGAGVALIDDAGRPGSRRAQIAFLDRGAVGGVVVHLVERDPL